LSRIRLAHGIVKTLPILVTEPAGHGVQGKTTIQTKSFKKRSIFFACSIRTAKVHVLQQSALFWKKKKKLTRTISVAKGNVVC